MDLIIMLIVIGLHRYVHFNFQSLRGKYLHQYCGFLHAKIGQIYKDNGWLAMCFLVLPLVVLIALVSSLIYAALGWLAYMIVSALLLWFMADARCESQDGYSDYILANFIAPFFWFALLGVFGFCLYLIMYLIAEQDHDAVDAPTVHALSLCKQVLDWLPVRLVALMLALTSNFAKVFPIWLKGILGGISVVPGYYHACLDAAVDKEEARFGLAFDRAIIACLILYAIFILGRLLG
jgi:membrane protein required for beta-lactamase induction